MALKYALEDASQVNRRQESRDWRGAEYMRPADLVGGLIKARGLGAGGDD